MGKITPLALAAALLLVPPLQAHSDDPSNQRAADMKAMGKTMKSLKAMVRGQAELDPQAMVAGGYRIADLSLDLARLFPADALVEGSAAKAAIWDNWDDFEERAQALHMEALALKDMPLDASPADFKAQFLALSQTCSGCHRKYKKRH